MIILLQLIPLILTINLLIASPIALPTLPYKAVVMVPVCDAVKNPLLSPSRTNFVTHYTKIPFSPDSPPAFVCRLYQLKKNEQVNVIALTDKEAYCDTDSFYYYRGSRKSRCTFWIQKKCITPLDLLTSKNLHVPPATDLASRPELYNKDVLTLTMPWYDGITKATYSVGTRFLRSEKEDTRTHYAVYIVTKNLIEKISFVPKEVARVDYPRDYEQARIAFLDLLRAWVHGKQEHEQEKEVLKPQRTNLNISTKKKSSKKSSAQEIIPYVHGGCSFSGKSPAQGFYLSRRVQNGKKLLYWQRLGEYEAPLDGFDCSNLVLSAAQIVGMPYYFKNTHALLRGLKDLKKEQSLQEGDLVWYSGHVLVVSDLKKNLLIEASGYENGHGRLHETSVNKVFKDIKDFPALINAYHSRKKVYRLTKTGRCRPEELRIRLLSLRSLWDQPIPCLSQALCESPVHSSRPHRDSKV